MTRPRLVAIVGATGTGKSDLAVSLARRFNGEILNADAMQLYKELPIITNKIPENEQQGVPHHLLGCIGLDEKPWSVGDFVKHALGTINGIQGRGRLPILVGGTHYYTQSLLFHDVLADQLVKVDAENSEKGKGHHDPDQRSQWPILCAPTHEILAKLAEVDPVMAQRWHPNDRRKIIRSLEIFLQTGRRASDIYAEQQKKAITDNATPQVNDASTTRLPEEDNSSAVESNSLRMQTLVLWLNAGTEVLYPRLDARVQKMLAAGLLDEVRTLSQYSLRNSSVNQTSGIWVSIGYKEFLPYIACLDSGANTSDTDKTRNTEKEVLLRQAIEATQAGTRQYAKRQIRWIRIKLLNALTSALEREPAEVEGKSCVRILDGDDISLFQTNVLDKAAELTEAFLNNKEVPLDERTAELLQPKSEDMRGKVGQWVRRECAICGVVGTTESDWNLHVKSKKHKKLVAKAKSPGAGVR